MKTFISVLLFALSFSSIALADHLSLPGGSSVSPAVAADVQSGASAVLYVTPAALLNSAAVQTLTYNSTSITWNASTGYNAIVTLTGNGSSIANPTNLQIGITYTMQLQQDSTGARQLAFGAAGWGSYYNWGAAGAPTISSSPNAVDFVSCFCASATKLLCTLNKAF